MKALAQTLHISLLDDCVFSERAATQGTHDTLDRIPGSALLGAAAAQLYPQLTAKEADAVFHSGRLRFCDGLPEYNGALAWPMPMCWHHAKNDKPGADLHHGGALYNFLHVNVIPKRPGVGDPRQKKEQAKQMRGGYVHACGQWIRPQRNYRMKTAISADTGRAADAQLFGYSALQRGQTFLARIEADADFDPALFARVAATLHGQIVLGRSRSAEYGRVRIVHAASASHAPQDGRVSGSTLVLWLLSDLAPCDAFGQPTLALDAQALGLPEGSRILWNKTFTRARRYSPWNAKRHGFDTERRVLTAGGVITVQLPADADLAQCTAQLQRGIGLHREAGLGQVWINPPLLSTVHPRFDAAAPAAAPNNSAETKPDHPLVAWMRDQMNARSTSDTEERAQNIAKRYRDAIETTRNALGYPDFATDFYPSRSQWGSVYEAARTRSDAELFRALFVGDDAIIKPQGKGWTLELLVTENEGMTWKRLSAWLKQQIGAGDTCDAALVRQLAHRLMDHPAKRKA